MFASWEAFYRSDVQSAYALLVGPGLFLAWLATHARPGTAGVEPWAARFVRAWAVVFAGVAIADVVGAGKLGWPILPFVLAGDYRVFALLLVVMEPGRTRPSALVEAAAWTLVVPAVAFGFYRGLGLAMGPLPETVLWLAYEVAFTLLAIGLALRLVPARVGVERGQVRRYATAVIGVVVLYYALWAIADAVILSGRDWGWGLRVVPNQLYYGALVPFAYARFFASRYAAASTSTQTSR